MLLETWLFFAALFLTAILLFMVVYEAILYTDLECDYVNPVDCCRAANILFYPELFFQGILFFSTGILCLSVISFIMQGASLGWILWHIWQAQQSGVSVLLEPTHIFSKLPYLKRITFFRVGFYLASFFFYLYMLVVSILTE